MRTDHHARVGIGILVYTAMLAVPVLGCASEPKPRPTALDPSSPAAPESPPLAVTVLASRRPDQPPGTPEVPSSRDDKAPSMPLSGAEHGHSHEGSPRAADKDKDGEGGKVGKQPVTLYTCPMHPEVISDKPGRCPKCGMTLVPKEPSEGKK
jgi:hypothetical protein